jgi:hypothetical protein
MKEAGPLMMNLPVTKVTTTKKEANLLQATITIKTLLFHPSILDGLPGCINFLLVQVFQMHNQRKTQVKIFSALS